MEFTAHQLLLSFHYYHKCNCILLLCWRYTHTQCAKCCFLLHLLLYSRLLFLSLFTTFHLHTLEWIGMRCRLLALLFAWALETYLHHYRVSAYTVYLAFTVLNSSFDFIIVFVVHRRPSFIWFLSYYGALYWNAMYSCTSIPIHQSRACLWRRSMLDISSNQRHQSTRNSSRQSGHNMVDHSNSENFHVRFIIRKMHPVIMALQSKSLLPILFFSLLQWFQIRGISICEVKVPW